MKGPKLPRAYVAALPLSAVPELQPLLARLCGPEGARANVVMMRLADDALARLDELVEAGLFGSRSEAAAFLVGAGIEAQKELFDKLGSHTAEIKRIRASLRQAALEALGGAPEASPAKKEKPGGKKRR